jgi:omega-amidase
MSFKISLAQLHIEPGRVERNRQTAVQMIEAAAANGSHLVLLPELWSSGYDLQNAVQHAQSTPDIWAELDHLAVTHQLAIGGSLLESRQDHLYNTFRWHNPAGGPITAYQKIHLFRLMEEDQWLTGGDHLQEVQTGWGKTGLGICYDLRFPELFRRYALNGVRAVALCAEWPLRRVTHWDILLRARAIENQMVVFAANAVGPSGGEIFAGSSTIISPTGEALVTGSQDHEDLLSAEIDPAEIDRVRQFMPVFQDRHPTLDRLD